MALLADYAITPDVFDETSYSHPDACDAELRSLKEVLLSQGVVRDLRSGQWRELFSSDHRPWHRRGKELLKKLRQQNRLVRFESTQDGSPVDDVEWCREALGTHETIPFTGGIIVTESVKSAFPEEGLVSRIDRLASAPWWASQDPSVTLHRNVTEYLEELEPVLRCANSIMFIDPHLDPSKPRYGDFEQILEAVGRRVGYVGSGPSRTFPMESDRTCFDQWFRDAFQTTVREAGIRLEVFIWDGFHDRFVISDLVGISLPNGFDTTTDPNSTTHWTRLSREDRDDVQREFDPASGRHKLLRRFVVE